MTHSRSSGCGHVGFDEMLLLGQTRRELGHKTSDWTSEDNRALMDKIGPNQNDDLPEINFVRYFNRTLPRDPTEFDRNVEEFMHCAHDLRVKKEQEAQQPRDADSVASSEPPQPKSAQKSKLDRARSRLNSAKQGSKEVER